MQEFRMLNYNIKYRCSGTVNVNCMDGDCCFRKITKYTNCKNMDNTYEIFFCADTCLLSHRYNNACFLTRKQMVEHLRRLKVYYPFKWSLTKVVLEDQDYWKLKLHIKGKRIYHKFILTLIRPFYEYPFNMYLRDAIKLHEIYKFKSILNLFIMISCVNYSSHCYANDDQSLCYFEDNSFFKFLSNKSLKSSLASMAKADSSCLHNIYNERLRDYPEVRIEYGETNGIYNFYNLEYWQSPEKLEERLTVYKQFLRLV